MNDRIREWKGVREMTAEKLQASAAPALNAGFGGNTAAMTLARAGVYAGAHGLEGLANAVEFWDNQPYGTRLYYGPGMGDYLQIGVLKAAVRLLSEMTPNACLTGAEVAELRKEKQNGKY